MGLASGDLLVLLGGLAVSYGFQMWPALLGICYIRFYGKGVAWGLAAGLTAITFTYITVGGLIGTLSAYATQCRLGIFFNLLVTILVGALAQKGRNPSPPRALRLSARTHVLSPEKRKWKKPIWLLTLVWFLFAIGPFAVLGNETDPANWLWGIPTAWIWQIVWWLIGCAMMYLLAFKLEMSTMPTREVTPLAQDD